MIARLQLFYGGDPLCWLRMPVALLQSYSQYVDKLEAAQSLMWVQRMLIGSNSVKKTDAQQQLNRWRRTATEGQVKRPTTDEERRGMAAAMGITVG